MKKIKAKVVVVGNSTVGKTTLLQMFNSNGSSFQKDYIITKACEVSSKIINIPQQSKDVELQFFDISGSEIYQSITQQLLDKVQFIMIVFDVTNAESFQNAKAWNELVLKINHSSYIPGVLVGTKTDLRRLRVVEMGEAKQLAQQLKLEYFETSAAKNEDIDFPFNYLAEQIMLKD